MKYINNERGQALLFVVVALTVALAVGMSVTSRTLSSVKRSTTTDTSNRVYTAAEGGVEFFLNQPVNVLENLSDGNTTAGGGGTECPAGSTDFADNNSSCVVALPSATGDNISSRAIVDVVPFRFNSPTGSPADHYWFYVNSGEVKEVRLNASYTGNLRICWNSQVNTIRPDLYYSYYNNTNGVIRKGILRERTGSHINPTVNEGAIPASLVTTAVNNSFYTTLDFTDCATLTIPNSAVQGLRIKSMFAPAKVGIFVLSTTSGSFPNQGYVINSIGEILENEAIRTVKKMRVYRSYPYMPSVFDYAIYSDSALGI